MKKVPKTPKQIERHFKGVANHHRLEILILVATNNDLTLDDIAKRLNNNFKTTSEHTRRLTHAGLIEKKYRGRNVIHTLSPYGKIFYNFIKTFQHS